MNKNIEKLLYCFKYNLEILDKNQIINILKIKEISNYAVNNDIFIENINQICKLYDEKTIFKCIELLYETNNSFFSTNFIIVFEKKFSTMFYKNLFDYFVYKKINKCSYFEYLIATENSIIYTETFITTLLNSKDCENLVNICFKYLIPNTNYLLEIKRNIKNKSYANRINYFIENNQEKLISNMIENSFSINKSTIKKEKFLNTIRIIIDELIMNQKLSYSDIEFMGNGSYSNVYGIGSKVLKLGIERETFKIHNHKRFLKPIIRFELKSNYCDEIIGCVEVVEKVDTKGITLKDAYRVYKDIRDEGLICLDCRLENIGKLKRKNKVYFEEINPVPYSIGYINECSVELNKGQVVLLDSDFVYDEDIGLSIIKDELGNYKSKDSITTRFEKKYQLEKRMK